MAIFPLQCITAWGQLLVLMNSSSAMPLPWCQVWVCFDNSADSIWTFHLIKRCFKSSLWNIKLGGSIATPHKSLILSTRRQKACPFNAPLWEKTGLLKAAPEDREQEPTAPLGPCCFELPIYYVLSTFLPCLPQSPGKIAFEFHRQSWLRSELKRLLERQPWTHTKANMEAKRD